MALTSIPTKTEASIGQVKSDNLPEGVTLDPRHWTTAEQLERMKDVLIALATDVGVDDTPAAGSLKKRVDELEEGVPPPAHATSHAGDGEDAIATATTTVAGLMSAGDKSKLDAGVPSVNDANTTIDTNTYPHGASVYTTAPSAVGVTANSAGAGKMLRYVQGGAGKITINAGSGVTLRHAATFNPASAELWSVVVLEWRTATEVHVSGDLEVA